MDETIQLLKDLTESNGISGYESPISECIQTYLQPLGSIHKDKLGSLICKKEGNAQKPVVMLAAHMDEIGFMVKHITKEGYIKFLPLGGWFDQVLLGQRVTISTHKGEVRGVIGVKPPHMLSAEEKNKVIEKKDMYIDIGSTSLEEVEAAGVRIGDPITPEAKFEILNNNKSLLGKAFDDRVGVAVMIETLKKFQNSPHPNTLFGVASVMEEVGVRGATTSVEVVQPDVAIILEADIAGDVPGVKPEESTVKLGGGPGVLFYDARMIPNLKLRDLVIELAKEKEIPLQISMITGGATDGAAIHLYKTGVPTIVITVPARHIHSHSSIIHLDDYKNALNLVIALIQILDEEKVLSLIN
ncbi:MAG: peptidase M28 [Anaerolineaceae bacterium]|nr:peptidase M28 [Anaerolineaceae bacterium]